MRKTNSLGYLVSLSFLACASAGCSSADHADLFTKQRAVGADLTGSGGGASLGSEGGMQGLGGKASGNGGKVGAAGGRIAKGSGGEAPGSGGDVGNGVDVGSGGAVGSGGSGGSVGSGGSGGQSTCIPHDEVCDGIDNNCVNGIADETCPQNCTGVALGGHGYMFCSVQTNQSEGITWQEAHTRCADAGMAVVQLETSEENLLVGQRLATLAAGGVEWAWIGASDTATEGKWVWDSGDQFWSGDELGHVIPGKFAAWDDGQPNDLKDGNCARIEGATHHWFDTDCQMRAPGLICETK